MWARIPFKLLEEQKVDISDRYYDCGMLMYDTQKQDVHAGGSGCGCSATECCQHICCIR